MAGADVPADINILLKGVIKAMTNTKMNIAKGLEKARSIIDKASVAVGSAAMGLATVSMNAFAAVEGVESPTIDLSGVNFDGLVTAITNAVPQVLPVVVTVVGIRKAISFIIGTIRGC